MSVKNKVSDYLMKVLIEKAIAGIAYADPELSYFNTLIKNGELKYLAFDESQENLLKVDSFDDFLSLLALAYIVKEVNILNVYGFDKDKTLFVNYYLFVPQTVSRLKWN